MILDFIPEYMQMLPQFGPLLRDRQLVHIDTLGPKKGDFIIDIFQSVISLHISLFHLILL